MGDREKMSTKLYVGNLPPECKDKELRELFSSFGDVDEVAVFNKDDGPGYAFVVSVLFSFELNFNFNFF